VPRREAPDERYLLALRDETRDAFQNQDEQIDRLRELRTMQKAVPVPPELRLVPIEIRDPTVADELQRVVATLVNQPPHLTVVPGREGIESAKRNATDREHFTEELLRVAGAREPGPDTLMRLADAVVSDGGGVTKFTFARDLWDERYSLRLGGYDVADEGPEAKDGEATGDKEGAERGGETPPEAPEDDYEAAEEDNRPEGRKPRLARKGEDGLDGKAYLEKAEDAKKHCGPPFRWTCPDIRTVYPVFQGAEIGEVIEVTTRPLNATFRKYRLGFDANGDIVPEELAERNPPLEATMPGGGTLVSSDSPQGSIDFIEHWDDEWVTYLVTGKKASSGLTTGRVVQQWRHGYGRHPYFFAPGLWMGWWRNRKVGWSVAETKRWLVEYRSYLWTIHAQQAARDTLPPVDVEVPDGAAPIRGDDGRPRTVEQYQIGKMYYGAPGTKRTPWQFPQVAASLREQITLVTEAIDKLSIPKLESNLGGMEASGFAINQVLAEARLRYDPLGQSVERMLDEVTRFAWHLIRSKVREKVWVYVSGKQSGWKGLGPQDLKADVRISWKLDPTLPSAAMIESRYHVEQVKAGFESMDMAIEAQGRNADEVRYGQALDRMRQSEWYTKYEDAYVLAEVGQGDMLEQAAEAQAAEQLAMQGQPGLPPGQPNPAAPVNGIPPGAPAGMGTPGIPPMDQMLMAPGGQGAEGVQLNSGGNEVPMNANGMPGAPNGSVPGVGPGFVLPEASAAAGLVNPLVG
jgi:hypothetical protein